ncbi:Na+/H+ antiporter NhaA [Halotalea alkalilenta]|uniref:Na+/H+ antiporter NhaA n=1 Tax=Halotalea alkalilenta TaxID=376489 RepID=UPI000693620A|nr:Na+/H+ antiporter NhaA [Halotalea alkalilenta]
MQGLKAFLSSDMAPGIALMLAAALALVVANSPVQESYFALLHSYLGGLSVQHWVNDALMALFFLMVGLEVKREFLVGQLDSWPKRVLPGIAAMGGVIAPALIYVAFNWRSPEGLNGWAIPTATDIAFALGVLSLLGSRVPVALKALLAAIAIIDDLIAVLVIALFYTPEISMFHLGGAGLLLLALIALNRLGVARLTPYLLLGAGLWWFVLQSGVHATLAGVALAMTIPMTAYRGGRESHSPLEQLEHRLAPWVGFLIVPLFGFANAGVSFAGFTLDMLLNPVLLGIACGLFFGKQIGIFLTIRLCVALGITQRPDGSSWAQVYGLSLLCGIGFTMSLFVNLLAFDSEALQEAAKVGVFAGSLAAGLLGWAALRLTSSSKAQHSVPDERAA